MLSADNNAQYSRKYSPFCPYVSAMRASMSVIWANEHGISIFTRIMHKTHSQAYIAYGKWVCIESTSMVYDTHVRSCLLLLNFWISIKILRQCCGILHICIRFLSFSRIHSLSFVSHYTNERFHTLAALLHSTLLYLWTLITRSFSLSRSCSRSIRYLIRFFFCISLDYYYYFSMWLRLYEFFSYTVLY